MFEREMTRRWEWLSGTCVAVRLDYPLGGAIVRFHSSRIGILMGFQPSGSSSDYGLGS